MSKSTDLKKNQHNFPPGKKRLIITPRYEKNVFAQDNLTSHRSKVNEKIPTQRENSPENGKKRKKSISGKIPCSMIRIKRRRRDDSFEMKIKFLTPNPKRRRKFKRKGLKGRRLPMSDVTKKRFVPKYMTQKSKYDDWTDYSKNPKVTIELCKKVEKCNQDSRNPDKRVIHEMLKNFDYFKY